MVVSIRARLMRAVRADRLPRRFHQRKSQFHPFELGITWSRCFNPLSQTPAPQPDEGAAAHLWQILMAGQIPVVLFFAIKWVPQAPRSAVLILVLQAIAGLAALAPVFLLHW